MTSSLGTEPLLKSTPHAKPGAAATAEDDQVKSTGVLEHRSVRILDHFDHLPEGIDSPRPP